MNANDRLAVLILHAVLSHCGRLGDEQAMDRLVNQVVADAFPEATNGEIRATIANMRDAIDAELQRQRRLS